MIFFPIGDMSKNRWSKLTPIHYTSEEHENTFQEQFHVLKKLRSPCSNIGVQLLLMIFLKDA